LASVNTETASFLAGTHRWESDGIEQTELPAGCLDVPAIAVVEVQEEAHPARAFRGVSVRVIPDDPRIPADVERVRCDESVVAVADFPYPGEPIDLDS